MSMLNIAYQAVAACPLCAGTDIHTLERLARTSYTFGPIEIALPSGGIAILRCRTCALAFKDRIPTSQALGEVMGRAATEVWKPAKHEHPLRARLAQGVAGRAGGIIDIGAANGDVLDAVADVAPRRSAFDIVSYPACAAKVTGEYVLGQFEEAFAWSGEPYALVTAFDVFEHFSNADAALARIVSFVAPEGELLLETGDYDAAFPSIGRWYYTALFEHTIFWNRASLEFAARKHGLTVRSFETVNHKGRLGLTGRKAALIWLAHKIGRSALLTRLARRPSGLDLNLIAHPSRRDHLLAVLARA